MKMPSSWKRRRAANVALVSAVVMLAIPISYAVAASTNSTQTVNVERYDDSCSYLPKHKIIGSLKLEQQKGGNSVTGTINLTGARPTSSYYLYLYADTNSNGPISACTTYWHLGKAKVDSDGHLSKSFTVTGTAGYNDFWFYGYS